MKRHLFQLFSSFVCVMSLYSCTNALTENEKTNIEKYTKLEKHDNVIYGKWLDRDTFLHDKKTGRIAISFDEQGISNERTFVENKPINNWHLSYYYYTKNGKVFMYRPSEKGLIAMDGELFIENEYALSDDGKELIIGQKIYTKIE